MLQHRTLCTVVLLLCSIEGSSIAAAPSAINYQGRLTTASGTPVADGPHTIVVKLWSSPTESAPQYLLWDSGPINVDARSGVFSTSLNISTGVFVDNQDVYYGVQIPPDPESLPRRRVVSSPYAIDSYHAGFSDSTNDLYVNADGDSITGGLSLFDGVSIRAVFSPGAPQINLYGPNGQMRLQTYSTSFSQQDMLSQNGNLAILSTSFPLDGTANGGQIVLLDQSGIGLISANAGVLGDNSLELPSDAINSLEMLNEPGIAASQSNLITTLSLEMTAITSVSITIPTDGYIHLQGRCGVRLVGGTGMITSVVHITEDPSEPASFPNAVEMTSQIGTFTPAYVSRIYFLAAGTHTFWLAGQTFSGPNTEATVYDPVLEAIFFPTSYGAVETFVSNLSAPDFPDVQRFSGRRANAENALVSPEVYKVDLRQLELQAANARAEAEHAEKELLKAKIAQRQEGLKK